jgi:GNAT superfamily N-acetyltransferase
MSSEVDAKGCREASLGDAEAIAALHADSWRRNYRGAYRDAYLDGEVFADRRSVWSDRLSRPQANHHTIVFDPEGHLLGFAHVILDEDPTWGALVDNLHVAHDRKGEGVGTRLMAEAARVVLGSSPPTGIYLWVLEQNQAAQAFYRARGGTCVGQKLGGPFPGGGTAPALRYAWTEPTRLIVC